MTQKRLAWLAIWSLVAAGILFGLSQWIANWIWHPLGSTAQCVGKNCKGYNFWSGLGSDLSEITLIITLISGILWFRRHYQCHEETCKKIGLHHVPGTPYRTCWHHHPVLSQHSRGKVPLSKIQAAHAAAMAVSPPDGAPLSAEMSHS